MYHALTKRAAYKAHNIYMSKDRVEAFSDGVFAVAITLLVLGLHVPDIATHSSFTQYAAALSHLLPTAISFALTFAIIASHWMSHHYFFNQLEKHSAWVTLDQ